MSGASQTGRLDAAVAMSLFSTALETNPIAWAEQRRLQRGAVYTRLPVLRYALMLAALSNLVLFFCIALQEMIAGLLALSTLEFSRALEEVVSADALLTGSLLFVVHSVAVAQGLQVASSTIAREKEARTWEMVLLTGIDARRIVRGKWLAAITSIWRVHRPLLVWRAAALMLLCAVLLQMEPRPSPLFMTVFVAPALLLVFSLLGVGIATAVGLLASVVMSREGSAYRLAMALHLLYVVLSLVSFFAFAFAPDQPPAPLVFTLISPLDGGIMSGTSILLSTYTAPVVLVLLIMVSTIFAILCAALIMGLLRLTERLAVAQRAIPSP